MLDALRFRRSRVQTQPLPRVGERFGVRSAFQVARDIAEVARGSLSRERFQFDLRSAGLLRPDLSLAAYAGLVPTDGLAPVFNLFDRVGGGRRYTQRVSRRTVRDFRGGRLSYDEHDGTDLVCPVGTPLGAAAPGTVVMIRDRWLRGGLTVAVDHGRGVVTQYTHCAAAVAPLGASLRRGDPVALSGASGFDMVQFFPWVPPHVHFMVYVDGTAVDPFLASGEAPRAGSWLHPNDPRPEGPLPGDPETPKPSDVDEGAVVLAVESCTDAQVKGELAACGGDMSRLAALLEDALAHDAWAWPQGSPVTRVRPIPRADDARAIAITVPLPREGYAGLRFADAPWTAPA